MGRCHRFATTTSTTCSSTSKSARRANLLVTVDEDGLSGHAVDGSPPLRPGEVDGSEFGGCTGAAGALTAMVSFGADGPHPTQAISLAVVTTPARPG